LRKPLVADKLVAMNRLGQKTGRGWYRYQEGDRKPVPDAEVVSLIEQTAEAAGIHRAPKTDSEILERCIYALINEGARVLEDGIAARAADIDVIYMTGYGFPAYRGGPMFYADTIGLPEVYDRITAFLREHGMYAFLNWNNVFTNPPLCITEEQWREAVASLDRGLAITDAAAA
jgi:3-hydroxyacyl-CoA dehydrogenase